MGGALKKFAFIFYFLTIFSFASWAKKNDAKAVFDSYPSRFAEINAAALSDAIEGEYVRAVGQYSKSARKKPDAFNFMRENYKGSPDTLKKIDALISDVKDALNSYVLMQENIKTFSARYGETKNLEQLKQDLKPLADLRNSLAQCAYEIRKADSSQYTLYLSKSILGVEAERRSGMVGIIDAQFESIINGAEKNIHDENALISTMYAQLLDSKTFPKKLDAQKLSDYAQAISQNTKKLRQIHSLYALLKNEDGTTQEESRALFTKEQDALEKLCTQSLKLHKDIDSLKTISETKLSKPKNPVEMLRSGRDEYSANLVLFANSFFSFGRTASELKRSQEMIYLSSLDEKTECTKTLCRTINDTCTLIEKISMESSVEYWKESASYYATCSQYFYNMNENELNLLEGLISDENEVKFPTKVLDSIFIVQEMIQKDIKILNDCNVKLSDGYAYRSSFLKDNRTIDENISKLKNTSTRISSIQKKAQELQLKAVLAKNEVNVPYSDAQKDLQKTSYKTAMEKLQKARKSYEQNLAQLNCDGDIKTQLFFGLNEMRDEIISKEQPIFYSELRSLKTQAKRSYDSGNFENASLVITQILEKRRSWENLTDITLDEDVELEHLRDYVNTALEIKTGREISPYDSKAPEMLQNLSIAQKKFEEAQSLFSQNQNDKAAFCLQEAKEKVLSVKTYFPRNHQASILNLRIEQFLDKDSFNETFPLRVEACTNDLKAGGALAMQAYSDLVDLNEINPSYPGLKKIITNAQYDLGLKSRPLDADKLKKSSELSSLAKKSLDQAGRDEVLLEHAKNLASQALAINPADSTAITVLDEVARRKGELGAVTLSVEDEDLYAKALSDYRNANFSDAILKVNTLLKNPNNARSSKIIKLKQNIERKSR